MQMESIVAPAGKAAWSDTPTHRILLLYSTLIYKHTRPQTHTYGAHSTRSCFTPSTPYQEQSTPDLALRPQAAGHTTYRTSQSCCLYSSARHTHTETESVPQPHNHTNTLHFQQEGDTHPRSAPMASPAAAVLRHARIDQ